MDQPPFPRDDVLDVRPFGANFLVAKTTVLMKTPTLELIRLVVPAGKLIPEHRARGEITIHCLEGRIALTVSGRTRDLDAGQLAHLPQGEPHALRGVEDASLLVTIALR